MDEIRFPEVQVGSLSAGDWLRLPCGEIGMVHDKVDQSGYRKVCVEVIGSRYPMRIHNFDVVVEHVTDDAWRRAHVPRRLAAA